MFQIGTLLYNENKMATRKVKNPNRVYLATCVGKLMAYERLGKTEEARQWADSLVRHLHKMGLLPTVDIHKTGV